MEQFNEAWYAEIRRHSRRDQLSFDYMAQKLGLKYNVFPGTLISNPYFERHPHNAVIEATNSYAATSTR
jgi:hypothetical protein